MNYPLLQDIVTLLQEFETNDTGKYSLTSEGFQQWIAERYREKNPPEAPAWEGKDKGRSADSVITTQLVRLNRYAKRYARSAMLQSAFSTQDEFIYLIILKALGPLSKIELIKKNLHDKPAGMKIIDRLLLHGWVQQKESVTDGRSREISITKKGLKALEQQMDKIRMASRIITGKLSAHEKMDLIRLMDKLDVFHDEVFSMNIPADTLLVQVSQNLLASNYEA